MHEPENFNESLANIKLALKPYEGKSKSGAHIHEFIKSAAPELNIRSVVEIPTGPGALTKFIETYLYQTVKRIGNKGGDILYGIGDDDVFPHPQMDETSIWKALVSPSAVNKLYLKMSDMTLFVAQSFDLDEDTHHIVRVTEDEHNIIRRKFLSSLTDDQHIEINAKTEQNPSYDTFVLAVRSNGLGGAWGKFRRDAFKRLLAERLEQIPVDKKFIPDLVDQLMASQQALHKTEENKSRQTLPPSTIQTWKDNDSQVNGNLHSARSLARSVIDNLSYNEIRAIRLPFGAVLDALSARK